MDNTQNFVTGSVVTAPSPATSGTSVTVSNGSLFPDPVSFGAYNICLWSQAGDPTPTTCEIVRVTAKTTSGDNAVLTIARAQEDTSGLSVATGWKAYYSLTQKYFDDLETALTGKLATYAGDSTAWDTAPTSSSTKPVTSGGVYTAVTRTPVSTETISAATKTLSISPTSERRFDFAQSVSACTYTLTPSQAGLVWVIRFTKSANDTISFDSNVTLDQTIEAAWTDCEIVFIAWDTTDIEGFVLKGE